LRREPDRGDRSAELRFLEDQEQRLLAIADELDSAGLGPAARAVMRAAEKVADLKLRALETD
jgi:hypothetical protein